MSHYCPNCGEPLAHQRDELDARPGLRRVPDSSGITRRVALGGDTSTGATWQEHRRPARAANVASDVATPALQSFVTGVAASFVAIVPAVAFDLSWLVVPTAGAVAFALSWWWLLRDGRAALWEVETYQREPEATPEPAKATTRLAVTLGNTHSERELPVEPDTLLRLARSLAGGARPFSERELVSAGLLSGRTQYEATRDALLAMGWLRWKATDRRQGLEWTAPGRAGLRALADGDVTVEDLRQVAG